MIYTSNFKLPIKEQSKQVIFLAGSIDLNLKNNWRRKVVETIGNKFDFFDPTITNHDQLNDVQMKTHIEWELNALELSDIILLNFLPESKSPISLVELGMYVKTTKLIVVCPDNFYQSRYIKTLCVSYNTPHFVDLKSVFKHF